ncbi:hypothetical protein [Streptomyces sp. NBC_01171]|uniref:hypothetical protein n=1 Tax=Streptomyces sp. NBC_01171 TaxID=2903757 RepID=UPI00386992DB|nr:hypothetical protein OG448_18970 [Streptomyces sp. NBC_01171]
MQVAGGSTLAFPETGTIAEADSAPPRGDRPGGGRAAFPRVVRPSDAGVFAATEILRGGPAALAGADATALLPRAGTPRAAAEFRPSGDRSGIERTAMLPAQPGSEAHDPHEVTVQLDSVQVDGAEDADRAGGADASDRPVFVDESGRRSRTFRRLGLLVAGLCAGYAVVIGVTLLSGSSDAPWLPVPQKEDKPASRVDSSPVPSASAPAAPAGGGRTGTGSGTDPAAPGTAPATVAAVPVPGRQSPAATGTPAARPPAAASPTPRRSAPPAPGGGSPKPTPTATASTEASPVPSTTAPSPVATESPAGAGGPQPQGSAGRPAAG